MSTLAALLLATHTVKRSFCDAQAGALDIIDAVGRMVKRGVLPSLRRLSLGAVSWEVYWTGQDVPRPEAAPHVETALLPGGRRPPGQLFWATDDVLPDLHVALGMRADYNWEQEVPESTMADVCEDDTDDEEYRDGPRSEDEEDADNGGSDEDRGGKSIGYDSSACDPTDYASPDYA